MTLLRVFALSAALALSCNALAPSATTVEQRASTQGASGLDARPANATCVAPQRPNGGYALRRVYESTLNFFVAVARAPGDSSRFYPVSKGGRVEVVAPNDAMSTGTFADLSTVVAAGDGELSEAGLLGMAFHPRFADNGQVFFSYTATSATSPSKLRSVIARYVSADGGKTIDPSSAVEILSVEQPFQNHKGGNIAFGPDGFLYIGLGDGGFGDDGKGDPAKNAQNTDVLLGKILRIDVDGASPYAIPPTNPFASGGGRPEIYAWGLRNPWRWSFDRATGELWAGDVGQDGWEEVDKIERGGNYGWSVLEGTHCVADPCKADGTIPPVFEYPHSQGTAIIGGYVYRGRALPELVGSYIYADFTSGRIWALKDGVNRIIVENANARFVTSFAEDEQGELYTTNMGSEIDQLVLADPNAWIASNLQSTGCFDVWEPKRPSEGLIPYDVSSPLWSDGASKERYLAIPDGTTIHAREDGTLDLPVGSVLVKTFRVGGKRVETRLLVHHDDLGWAGYTYAWDASETDATLVPPEGMTGIGWTYPSRGQCDTCHHGAPLGLQTAQLNRDFDYAPSRAANQLVTLSAIGMLTPPIDDPSALPSLPDPAGTADTNARARSYLHANCSFCHRPGGLGRGALDLRFSTPFSQMGVCNTVPQEGNIGVPDARVLFPGDPARSVLSLRMHATNAARMPPLASSVVDQDGAGLVDAFIRDVAACP